MGTSMRQQSFILGCRFCESTREQMDPKLKGRVVFSCFPCHELYVQRELGRDCSLRSRCTCAQLCRIDGRATFP